MSECPIMPLRNRVVVKRILKADMSPGGIYIGRPEDTGLVKELVEGEVVAVGPGDFDKKGNRTPMWGLKPGDKITFSPVLAADHEVDGETFTIIRRDAVVGMI